MPMRQPPAHLRVYLGMRIEVSIAARILGIAASIRPKVGVVMGQAHARRHAFLVVGHVEVPVVGCGAYQGWMVSAANARRERCLRGYITVVCSNSHTAQSSG